MVFSLVFIYFILYIIMPNITKLKLQDDIEYTLSAPILLDQEESASTTSAPSSNYLKTKIDDINNTIFNTEERLQQEIDGLSASIELINYIIDNRVLKVVRLVDGTDLNTVTEVGKYTVNNPINFIPNYNGWVCLDVTRFDNNGQYPLQVAIADGGVMYSRACAGGTWGKWYRLDRTAVE